MAKQRFVYRQQTLSQSPSLLESNLDLVVFGRSLGYLCYIYTDRLCKCITMVYIINHRLTLQ